MKEINQGDGVDLAALFECAYPAMSKQAARIAGKPDAVDDIVQSAALGMVEHLDKLRELDKPSRIGYMVQAAKYQAISYMRKAKRRQKWTFYLEESSGEDNTIFINTATPEDIVISREQAAALAGCISQLPEREHDMLLMQYMEYSREEICRVLGIKKDYYRKLLSRARSHALAIYNREVAGE